MKMLRLLKINTLDTGNVFGSKRLLMRWLGRVFLERTLQGLSAVVYRHIRGKCQKVYNIVVCSNIKLSRSCLCITK